MWPKFLSENINPIEGLQFVNSSTRYKSLKEKERISIVHVNSIWLNISNDQAFKNKSQIGLRQERNNTG